MGNNLVLHLRTLPLHGAKTTSGDFISLHIWLHGINDPSMADGAVRYPGEATDCYIDLRTMAGLALGTWPMVVCW